MLFSNTDISTWCFVIAAIFLIPCGFALAQTKKAASLAQAFPRNRYCGWVLSTLALAWGGALLYYFPFEFVVAIKNYIPFIILVSIPLTWFWMGDLLAARSLGGLMALLPAPVFLAARFQDSAWRLVVVVTMYMFAIAGMAVILYPYLVRDCLKWLTDKPIRLRAASVFGVALGLALIFAAICIF